MAFLQETDPKLCPLGFIINARIQKCMTAFLFPMSVLPSNTDTRLYHLQHFMSLLVSVTKEGCWLEIKPFLLKRPDEARPLLLDGPPPRY